MSINSVTLQDLYDNTVAEPMSIANCSPRFLPLLNRAQTELADCGRWWGTYAKIRVCIDKGCITWPAIVRTVEGFTICNTGVPIRNQWWEFQTYNWIPAGPQNQGVLNGGLAYGVTELRDRGRVWTAADFLDTCNIRLYPQFVSDVGKKVLIQGIDQNGNPVRTQDGAGNWIDGEYITLAMPYAQSLFSYLPIPGIDGVQKPVTNGQVTVTAIPVGGTVEGQISVWQSWETRPNYARTYLQGIRCINDQTNTFNRWCCDRGDGCAPRLSTCIGPTAEALVRLAYRPALVPSDWLFIQNVNAVTSMMKSLDFRDKNEYQLSETERGNAIRSLRNQLEAYEPIERTFISVQPYGAAPLCYVTGGFI